MPTRATMRTYHMTGAHDKAALNGCLLDCRCSDSSRRRDGALLSLSVLRRQGRERAHASGLRGEDHVATPSTGAMDTQRVRQASEDLTPQ